MNLSVSTWNYLCAFGDDVDLEVAAGQIQEEGFGVEFWTCLLYTSPSPRD